uniref:myosin-1-like isoform X1 n=2 Tax=Oncorhynchus gorbuscha TaxID=8017 RepID=UPI001EAF41E8|nr:myosin-1-like isoform X1 [Oncorhynchus gorbuscha]
MISSRSATDYRSGLGDHGYSRETQRPAEIQKLLVEFRTLYHERLRRIDQSDDSREEALQSKVGVLQSFVRDLSEQNEVLIQALEAEEAEGRAVEGRTASLHKELERRLSLALCPMPVDLAGTTATFLRTPREMEDHYRDAQTHLSTQDAILQQLKEACLSQQEAQVKVEEREAQVQELQDTITELHQEMTRKDQDKLTQLQELHQLESRVKQLTDQVRSSEETIGQLRQEVAVRVGISSATLSGDGSTTDPTGSSPVPHLTEQRGRELLKTELSCRDATIQRLRRDVLLSHQARDSQSAQLDVHGQRISQLQTELQESQLELQRGHSRREQQQRDLQTQTQQAEELHTQLAEVKGRLVQVEGENEALMGYKREQGAEVERLALVVCSLQRSARDREGTESVQAERRCVDLEGELTETRAQLTECQDRLQEARRRAKEQTQKFQAKVSSLKSQHGCVSQQLQDSSAEVQRLQRSLAELHGREMEWERETSALQGQLGHAREELHSAILRRQAQQQKEELFGELQREVDRLKNERQEMRKKLCGTEEELKRLRDEQHQLKDKVRESDVQAVWLQSQADVVGRELWEESAQRDRELWEWRDRYHAASEGLRLREAGLEEVQRARDTALRGLRLQEEKTHSLGAQMQELQHSLDGLQGRLAQKEEMVVALRVKLQDHEEDARVLRQQLLSSQDALQQVAAELRSCKREREEQDSQCVETEERLAEIRADLVQLQQQYTTCYAQLVQEEVGVGRLREELREVREQRDRLAFQVTENQDLSHDLDLLNEKHKAAQHEVTNRDETVLRLTTELSTAQEHLKSAQDELSVQAQQEQALGEEVQRLQKEVSCLQGSLSQREEDMEAQLQTTGQLQQERDSLLTQRDNQQGAVCVLRGELQRWQAEARAQQESREEEVLGLRAELQETQGRLQQCRATMKHLRSDLEHAQRQTRQAEEEASDRENRLWGQEAELSRLRAVLQEAESRAADTETRLQPLTQSLELYRVKYQACLTKISQQDSTLQAQDEDLKEARAQVVERDEHVLRLCAQALVLQGELKAHCAQLESGDDALNALSQHLRDTQRDLESSCKHSQECEMVISTMRDNTAALRRQVEEQEESVVKSQADLSVYRASHIHSDSDYDSQLCRIQELQQAFSQTVEQCAQASQDLSVCQSEVRQLREEVSRLTQLKDSTVAEVLRLQEAGRQLQAETMMEGQRRLEEVGAQEQRAARLEQDLQAAHTQCAKRQQAVQKRDNLLRRSEADLLEARETLRSRAVEVERQAAAVRGLEADVQRARREGQQREAECGSLRTQLMTLREELKEAQGRCRDMAQELARQEEKVLLVEGGSIEHRNTWQSGWQRW